MSGPQLLSGRTAVVTGAARGIGLSIANRLAEHGAGVALLDLDGDGSRTAAEQIAARTGVRTAYGAVDVTDPDAVRAAADRVEGDLGLCDVVVVNAGVLALGPVLDLTLGQFEAVLRVNLTGSFVTATEFSRRLVAAGRAGQVIFSSSLFGLRGGAGNAAYSASKFGVVGLAQSMAADLAPYGIRVNSVCPGQIDTPMLDQLFRDRAAERGTQAGEERAAFEGRIPVGRLGSADEVADVYVFLASDLSGYVTGQQLTVDGGWSVG